MLMYMLVAGRWERGVAVEVSGEEEVGAGVYVLGTVPYGSLGGLVLYGSLGKTEWEWE